MNNRKFALALLVMANVCFAFAQQTKLTPEDLDQWSFYGQGTKMVESHNMFFMKEAQQSQGVMLVSPESYGDNVVLKYEVMALTPATVCVAILSASNIGDDSQLTIPSDYDGAMQLWIDGVQSYFYAFRNAPHNYTPFIRKYPVAEGAKAALASYKENVMHSGLFHTIEMGRNDGKLWLKIDGKKILKTEDEKALSGGHIAFRIRGTAGEYAACLIRNVEITQNK